MAWCMMCFQLGLPAPIAVPTSADIVRWLWCRYLPRYVREYTQASIPEEALHLAEFWVDMRYANLTSA